MFTAVAVMQLVEKGLLDLKMLGQAHFACI
ncbi:hypothetical protein ACSE3M_19440 [Bacillus velezensis]